jgi:PAS domain S-box-containing protein
MTFPAVPIRVLNVNDDDPARRYKSQLLTAAGFEVTDAARIDAARACLASEAPDLILLDVELPDGTGIDLCRDLQPQDAPDAFEGNRPYAIVLISAHMTRPDDIARGIDAGADAYLVEPLDDTYLVTLLRSLAARHARRRAVAEERAMLRAGHRRYRTLSATIGDAVYEWDFTTGRVEWSEAMHRMLGCASSEVGSMHQWRLDRTHPDDRPRVRAEVRRAIAARDTSWEIESRLARADGSYATVVDRATIAYDGDGRAQGAVGVVSDVTERQQLMDQLRLAQKMDAVGQLAGGIAHDFNNVLTSVMGFTGLIKHEVRDRPSVISHADEIEAAAQRASDMVAQLMAFSRHQEMTPDVVDLNDVVVSGSGMLDRLIGAHIRVQRDLDPQLPTVRADRTQIEQVLLNLVVNARDAMPDGGDLRIATGTVNPGRKDPRSLPPGRYVRLSVTDTGIGMDDSTRARIFEPFFTTKERGRGTGLGLSTVYGIVKQSGGHIRVESASGAGATFEVFLPALDLPVARAEQPPPAQAFPARAGETVLVVEDEPSVRRLACEVLSRAGYTVLDAADGLAALARAEAYAGRIDLLLTDLVLPGLSGRGLAQAFQACQPEGGVLYMTGYAREANGSGHTPFERGALLMKPFSRGTLLRAARQRIDAARQAAPPRETA